MKPQLLIIGSVALIAVLTWVGFTYLGEPDSAAPQAVRDPAPEKLIGRSTPLPGGSSDRFKQPPSTIESKDPAMRVQSASPATPRLPASPAPSSPATQDRPRYADQNTSTNPPSGSQRDLWRRAKQVEYEANRRLDQLTQKLNLSDAQQDTIFPILARNSTSYTSDLAVEGENAGSTASDTNAGSSSQTEATVEEQVYEVLDAEQQYALEEEIVNRDLWWSDIINELEQDLIDTTNGDSGALATTPTDDTPAATTSGDAAADTGDAVPPPAYGGGGNLFDLSQ